MEEQIKKHGLSMTLTFYASDKLQNGKRTSVTQICDKVGYQFFENF